MSANPATSAAANPVASPSLYVGDLSPEVTESMLYETFNAIGPVASVRVCRDAATRRSLGYAYVNFHRVDDAGRALEVLNYQLIKDRPMRIMWCHRDPTLRRSGVGNIFVNHLDKATDNKRLNDVFSVFGNILSCKVATKPNGESLGYGFVHFESEEAAQAAISKVNAQYIDSKQVTVALFKSKKERGASRTFTNVFVKNLPGEVAKQQIEELFSKFGQITSSTVTLDKNDSKRAFGFVNFETSEQATAAVEGLNNFEFHGRALYVARAQKRDEREKVLREHFEQRKVERQKKSAGVNLYIKYLADTVDDEKLRVEFAKYGSITSAKVMRDDKGNSRGFGFVCYSVPEEATRAVTEMNGRMLENKPLYVALHQRKEQRRAQLSAQFSARGPMPMQQMYPQQGAPMMYPGMAQRNFMYQQGMGMARGPFRAQQGGVMQMRQPQANINYQLMPAPQMQRMPMQAMAQRGGRPRQVPRQGVPVQGAQAGQRPMNGAVPQQYANQVRPQQRAQQQEQPKQVTPAADQPLTAQLLASTPEMQKQLIGERLFPLIKAQQPELAGKITGMLLEMDNSELLLLLESSAALTEKINEAIAVLESVESQ